MKTSQLLEFWGELDGANVHPEDSAFVTATDFATELLPQPWIGPLATADIFVLSLNPGLASSEADYEKARPDFARALGYNLNGGRDYIFLDEAFSDHPGAAWVKRVLGRDIHPSISSRLCHVELVPYHSKEGHVASKVAKFLPSSSMVRSWVRENLRPRAEAGDVAMIVTRGARFWGLTPADARGSVCVYSPALARGGLLTAGTPGGRLIRARLGSEKPHIITIKGNRLPASNPTKESFDLQSHLSISSDIVRRMAERLNGNLLQKLPSLFLVALSRNAYAYRSRAKTVLRVDPKSEWLAVKVSVEAYNRAPPALKQAYAGRNQPGWIRITAETADIGLPFVIAHTTA